MIKDLQSWSLYRSYSASITKTRLYSFDPLKPNFYTVKLGFTGVYINFLATLYKYKVSAGNVSKFRDGRVYVKNFRVKVDAER